MRTVLVVMSADFFHAGHLNIIKVARELGQVTVALATEGFNARYKRLALMSYEQRKAIVENIKGVERVIPQESLDLAPVLRELKPDYFVHGDDWQTGPLRPVRQQVIDLLQEWGGILVEPPYTAGVSSTELNAAWRSRATTPEARIHRFRRLLAYQPVVRILEVHSGLAGLIAEHTRVEVDGRTKAFDGMWFSSLTDALVKGKPGDHPTDLTSQLNTIHDILEGTTKPLIVDGRNGGPKEHFVRTVKTMERLGVSAVAIEDRAEPGAASLRGGGGRQEQEDARDFAAKISAGKRAQVTADFSIIARISSLELSGKLEDAIGRAQAYLEAGADGVMVNGRPNDLAGFLRFCQAYTKLERRIPLLSALPGPHPPAEDQMVAAGVQVVIYPDQLLRASYASMIKTAKALLLEPAAADLDESAVSLREIHKFIPGIPESALREDGADRQATRNELTDQSGPRDSIFLDHQSG